MKRRGATNTRSLQYAVLATLIAFAAYFLYMKIREGFAQSTVTIAAKLNSSGQVTIRSFSPTLLSPSGAVSGGTRSISISGMSPTLGSLSNITVQYKRGATFVAPPITKVDNGPTTLRFESGNRPLRLPAARMAASDSTPKLPRAVSELRNTMKILNIEVGNLQGIDLAASENVRFMLSFV